MRPFFLDCAIKKSRNPIINIKTNIDKGHNKFFLILNLSLLLESFSKNVIFLFVKGKYFS